MNRKSKAIILALVSNASAIKTDSPMQGNYYDYVPEVIETLNNAVEAGGDVIEDLGAELDVIGNETIAISEEALNGLTAEIEAGGELLTNGFEETTTVLRQGGI